MPNYVPILKETHKNQRWTPNSNFAFAAKDALCPIVSQEAPTAVLYLPIAFSKVEDQFRLFAVQGLEAGRNYLVDAEGRWLGGYIPAAYRGYPFALAPTSEEKHVLCVDTDSGLVSGDGDNAFFDDQGEPNAQITEILDFFSQLATAQQRTHSICQLLQQLELLEPWPITVKKDDKDLPLEGLFRVDEAKFNTLDAETLISLRDKGVLPMIFSQLLSMKNLSRLAQSVSNLPSGTALPDELSFDFAKDDGNISFEGL